MKTVAILACILMTPILCVAQVEQKSVLQSDVSYRYKKAVRDGFYKELNNASGLEEGYHGFVDLGYTLGIGDYKFGRFEINTTHGYQFNPHFFVGGGLGFHFMSEYNTPNMNIALDYRKKQFDIPIYGNVRWTIINNKVTPFIDGKIGFGKPCSRQYGYSYAVEHIAWVILGSIIVYPVVEIGNKLMRLRDNMILPTKPPEEVCKVHCGLGRSAVVIKILQPTIECILPAICVYLF